MTLQDVDTVLRNASRDYWNARKRIKARADKLGLDVIYHHGGELVVLQGDIEWERTRDIDLLEHELDIAVAQSRVKEAEEGPVGVHVRELPVTGRPGPSPGRPL